MTSPSRARRRAGARTRADAAPAQQPDPKPRRPPLEPKPFTPRRALFVVLLILFAAWLAGLLVMYFTTAH